MRRITPRSAASNVKVLVIVLVCVAVVGLIGVAACCGLGYWGIKTGMKEIEGAQAAAESFMDQLKAGQLQPAYQSTAADFKTKQTFEQFSTFLTKNPNFTAHTSRNQSGFNFSNVNNVKTATLQYTLNGPTGATNCTVTVTDSGSGWQVSNVTVP
jgi:hypothetical protein